ncbi:Maltase 1 [Orchesella cincta]|uniref:alpha-glucosidase n=1 Tax=Orchesella cincta TaxID=48709 RepID=A0A1D2M4P2_ORCCI|nr:Maltase 1 [Orchesella cincta]
MDLHLHLPAKSSTVSILTSFTNKSAMIVYYCVIFFDLFSSRGISIKLPENPNPQPLKWWQSEIIYQVYPRSFMDSDGDGVGDLKGIESKVDYIADLGAGAVWLSPIYESPMKDFGYDISNFTNIDPIFGTMDDFLSLATKLRENGLKLVMDFVPNHSSDLHVWFNLSVHRQEKYEDFYVWKNASGYDSEENPIVPNNWVSFFGGSAWEWNEIREQFYFHQFVAGQPDLNFENPEVLHEMLEIMKFWLDMGVDGFRMDTVPSMFEDQRFLDEAEDPNRPPNSIPTDYSYWSHIYTYDLPATRDSWQISENYLISDGKERCMMIEAYVGSLDKLFLYYGTKTKPIAHFPFNFEFITRSNQVDPFNMLILLLPGSAVTYYGEEIGMTNTNLTWEETVDPPGCQAGPERYQLFSRDPERTPMQWNYDKNSGFSTGDSTWLPINPNYKELNVQAQNETSGDSHLKVYKQILSLRKTDTWKYGSLEAYALENGQGFGFARIYKGSGFIVLANYLDGDMIINVGEHFKDIPDSAMVYTTSVNFQPEMSVGSFISTKSVTIRGKHSIILTFSKSENEKKNDTWIWTIVNWILLSKANFYLFTIISDLNNGHIVKPVWNLQNNYNTV